MTNWRYRFDIANIINSEDLKPAKVGKQIAKILKENKCFEDFDEDDIQYFDEYADYVDDDMCFQEFDYRLNNLYDYCDEKKIWLGI